MTVTPTSAAPAADVPPGPGEVITFYSYKGGTGRTMALANVAWILATQGKRVLVVDWDLEAPGLHRYFRPLLPDKELVGSDGVLDMVWRFSMSALDVSNDDGDLWYLPYADVLEYAVSLRWDFKDKGTIDFIGAGRQDASYSTRLATFDWTNFYERLGGGHFLQAVRQSMRENYDYVLIDSRTGLSDTAGICTVELPDTVVLAFTMNIQSMAGAAAVGESVLAQSKARILPVPMRVEDGENARLESARTRARERFGQFLIEMDDKLRSRYWGEIEIPYMALYAYDELLAPIEDRHQQELTLLHSMERLTAYLTRHHITGVHSANPSEADRQKLRDDFALDRRSASGPTFGPSVRYVTAQGTIDRIAVRIVGKVDIADAELPVRLVIDRRGRLMVQKWIPAELRGNRRFRALLDAEVHAGVRFAEFFLATRYPPELPRLVGYDTDGPEPFVLLEEYRGAPVTDIVVDSAKELFDFYRSLLAALRLLEDTGVVHGTISSDCVLWDGSCVQLVGFERASGFETTTPPPNDDLDAAVRVFVAVATRRRGGRPPGPLPGEYLVMLEGIVDKLGRPMTIDAEHRPTVAALQDRTPQSVRAVSAADPEHDMIADRAAFREAAERKRARAGESAPARAPGPGSAATVALSRTALVLLVAVVVGLVVAVALLYLLVTR